jgi:hypothetical protein
MKAGGLCNAVNVGHTDMADCEEFVAKEIKSLGIDSL